MSAYKSRKRRTKGKKASVLRRIDSASNYPALTEDQQKMLVRGEFTDAHRKEREEKFKKLLSGVALGVMDSKNPEQRDFLSVVKQMNPFVPEDRHDSWCFRVLDIVDSWKYTAPEYDKNHDAFFKLAKWLTTNAAEKTPWNDELSAIFRGFRPID